MNTNDGILNSKLYSEIIEIVNLSDFQGVTSGTSYRLDMISGIRI
jgi:hypothetical protein